jgi:hypothetical protein
MRRLARLFARNTANSWTFDRVNANLNADTIDAIKIETFRQTLAFTHERHEFSVSCTTWSPGRPSSIDPCSVTSFAIQEAAFLGPFCLSYAPSRGLWQQPVCGS